MSLNPVTLSIPIFFFLIGVEVLYDRIKNKKLYRLNDGITNIACGIFEQITGVFGKVVAIGVYDVIFTHWRIWTIPGDWYWLVILFLGVDFFYYWAHRYSHQINLMWLGHVVHHQSEDYNLSVALRQGAFQKFFTFVFMLPLALIGFKTEWFLIISAYVTLYQFWIHTEAIRSMGWLEYVFNTPSHHRVHHGRDPKYIDKNHAGTFIFWDMMFGTFQKEEEKPVYGIIKPTNTWNPVQAHLQPFINLWNDLKLVKSWKNKVKLFFMKPGWLPEENGGYRTPTIVHIEEYNKFVTPVSKAIGRYVLIQFAVILGGTTFLLFGINTMPLWLQALLTALITVSIMAMGVLLEGKSWAARFEYLRLIISAAVTLALFQGSNYFILVAATTIIYSVISFAWVYYYFRPLQILKPAV